MKLVFVAGLTHSGSTVLDLLLGGHSELIGLGEAASLVCQQPEKLAEPDRRCSCGARLGECVFWSTIVTRLGHDVKMSSIDRYRLLLAVFQDVFGSACVPVDSSKSLSALKLVTAAADNDLRILHVIRDVRAWSVSRADVDQRHRRLGLAKIRAENPGRLWLYYVQQLAVVRFAIWYRGNRRIQRFLAARQLPSLDVSYEELALNGNDVVGHLCEFLGIPAEPLLDQIASTRSHVALGNPMRLDPLRRSSVVYDYRWLCRREWVLASLVMPHVMAYNHAHVYRGKRIRETLSVSVRDMPAAHQSLR